MEDLSPQLKNERRVKVVVYLTWHIYNKIKGSQRVSKRGHHPLLSYQTKERRIILQTETIAMIRKVRTQR